MEIRISRKDLIWSYIGTFLSLGANILMLPFLVYYLEPDCLGLWYLFASIGAIGNLFDFGFSVTFARNITYCWSGATNLKKESVEFTQKTEPDFRLMKNVLATCKLIYLIISLVAFLLMMTLGTAYVLFISKGVDRNITVISWIIYAVSVFLGLYYGYYSSFLRGVGAIDTVNKNIIIARTTQIVLTILLLLMGTGLIGACSGHLAYGTIFRVLGKKKFYKYKDIGIKLKKIEEKTSLDEVKKLFTMIWHNAWKDGLISLCNYLSNYASTLICSMYLTLADTGIYSLGVQIVTAVSTVAAVKYNTYQPAIQADYVAGRRERVKSTMSFIVVSYVLLFAFCMIGMIVLGLPLLNILKPDTMLSIPVILGLGFYQFLLKFRNLFTSYFSSTNRIPYVKSFLISAVLGVLLSVLFLGVFAWGIKGLIFAQIISQLIYNAWYWPIKASAELELTPVGYIRLFALRLRGKIKRY